MLEKAIISGVTHDTSEAKVSIIGVPDRPGIAAQVFRALATAGVNIDMIVQNVSQNGEATISFTLPKTRPGRPPSRSSRASRRDRRRHASSRTPTSRRCR